MLHRDLTLRGRLPGEPDLDRRSIGPRDAHVLLLGGRPDRALRSREPLGALPPIAPRAVEPRERHRERLALRRLERAVVTLADHAKALDALVPHRDGLAPPLRQAVRLVDVL